MMVADISLYIQNVILSKRAQPVHRALHDCNSGQAGRYQNINQITNIDPSPVCSGLSDRSGFLGEIQPILCIAAARNQLPPFVALG